MMRILMCIKQKVNVLFLFYFVWLHQTNETSAHLNIKNYKKEQKKHTQNPNTFTSNHSREFN